MKNIKLLQPLFRGLPIIVAVVTGAVMLASRYLRYTTPQYESTTRIKLADVNEGPSSANLFKDFDVFANTNKIGAEVEVLKSKVLVAKALDSLDFGISIYRLGKMLKTELYHQSPIKIFADIKNDHWYDWPFMLQVFSKDSFALQAPGGQSVREVFGAPLLLGGANLIITKNEAFFEGRSKVDLMDHYEFIVYSKDKLVDLTVGKMDVTPIDKDIPIIRISLQSPVPEKAANFVNQLAQTYIQDYISNKYATANITVEFLEQQLAEVGGRLSNSENVIQNYRDDHNIINIRQETETDLRKISQLKIQLANLEMNLAAIDSLNAYVEAHKDNFLQTAPNFEAFTDLLSTELVKKIKQLQSEKRELLTRYTEEDEKVKVVNADIADLTAYLIESIHNTRKNYEIKYREIYQSVQEAETVFRGLPGKEKRMAINERNFSLNEQLYNYLHQKMTEAEIARAATISFHRVIEKGEVPVSPVSPNRVLIIAVAGLLGLLGSVSLIYMVHALKAKVNDTDTIEKNTETPLVAAVPMLRKPEETRTWFNNLAIQLEVRQMLHYPAVVTYSSFAKKEGKAFNTTQLAAGLVALGKKVLVVDAVAQHSFDSAGAPVAGEPGIVATKISGLHYYTGQDKTKDDVIIQADLEEKLADWKTRYDAIVICNEPLTTSSNALVYMAVASLNLFILDSRRTAAKKIVEADLLQQEFKIPAMHYVLNRAHYNPSLLILGWNFLKTIYQRSRKRK